MTDDRYRLYSADDLQPVIDDMARQAAALLDATPTVLLGMLRRGAPLADRLAERLVRHYGMAPPLRLDLSVKRYADDLSLLYPETRLDENAQHAALDLTDYNLLVVDDVLYTGHSLLKVVDYLARKRPAQIRVAVLVDRCVAQMPLHADVVGAHLQIAPGGIIDCHVPPYEPDFRIELVQPERAP